MKKLIPSVVAILLASFSNPLGAALPQAGLLGMFTEQTGVGAPAKAGSCRYDSERQEYRVASAGQNIWATNDQFQLVWKKLSGDFIVNTRAEFIGQGVNPHRKLGWMVRATLAADSPHVNAVVHGDGLTSLQFRRSSGAKTEEVKSAITGADVIQLERKGSNYTMSVARFGEAFVTTMVTNLDFGAEVYVGIFVCSHEAQVIEEAVFRNVRIIIPARDNFVPYREYIGSYLETMEITNGQRRIVHQTLDSMQAPNWTPDGKALIYNRNGKLFRFDLGSHTVTPISTEFADHNNNDHALSFDGKHIGISHQPQQNGGKSMVYIVPIEGGTPKLITPVGPSYLHGWSPDGQQLVYTGERNGEFDIYRMPVAGSRWRRGALDRCGRFG